MISTAANEEETSPLTQFTTLADTKITQEKICNELIEWNSLSIYNE